MNPYYPMKAQVAAVRQETGDIKTFTLQVEGKKSFFFEPGQFVQVSLLGYGESPFSISSTPGDALEITVKNVGDVTQGMFKLEKGDELGVRGPFGTYYPLEKMAERDLVFVAGGFGMASLASGVKEALHKQNKFGQISLYYGARSPREFIFADGLTQWKKQGVKVNQSIDKTCAGWKGCVGFVPELLDQKPPSPRAAAFVCGPPRMIDASAQKLVEAGIPEKRIFVSLERRMSCGVGKCGHCLVRGKYVCRDGPVFTYAEAKKLVTDG
ncbi:FAD/NAD(P)-binding protein [Candidatus Micrarchaeota archaeon]|nr:FAD/NAD(P)-binding protein [Candidatus Micrarchaeota archaeon]